MVSVERYLYDKESDTLRLFIEVGLPDRMKYFFKGIAKKIGDKIEEFSRYHKNRHPEKIELNFYINARSSYTGRLKSIILALDKIDGWLPDAIETYYLSREIEEKEYNIRFYKREASSEKIFAAAMGANTILFSSIFAKSLDLDNNIIPLATLYGFFMSASNFLLSLYNYNGSREILKESKKKFDEYTEKKEKVMDIIKNAKKIDVVIDPIFEHQKDTLKQALEETSRLLVYEVNSNV